MALAVTLAATSVTLGATACGLSDTSPVVVTTPPPDLDRAPSELRWEPWQGVNLPFAREDGPAKLTEAALGYSHTPQGAALAAIHHTVRISLAPDDTWARTAAQSLMPGPGKDAWVLARAQISVTQPASPVVAPRITAYKFTTYTADRAELLVYSTYSDNSVTSNKQTVVWSSNDWRLLLPDPVLKTVVVESVPAIPADAVQLSAAR
ncbi:hypothetical protein [Nocardia uniformis]|uniref:hypothetical protein n=1 Tax=Nocardia uniformis TaxID=53432 RepID=UPI001FE0F3EB|nr:hypothetical protein [Nocardia uniformis]